jgi:putative hydrolase of the HAD superfamily
MKYGAVIFDLYGTLIDFYTVEEFRQAKSRVAEALGAPASGFLRVWTECMGDRMVNRFGDVEGTLRHICTTLGVQPEPDRLSQCALASVAAVKRELRPRPAVPDTINALKQAGLRVGLLSDCTIEVPMAWPETPLAPLIDEPVFSCVEEMAKPDPRMYVTVCERLGVRPEECLYVGDGGSRELTGAREAGLNPVLIRVGYDSFIDPWRADALEWDGPTIRAIPEVLSLVSST